MILEIYLQIEHIHHPDFGPYRWAKVNMDVGPGIVFLPFLVLDMVIANVLLALGMQTLSPSQVSLPFKILLFVAVLVLVFVFVLVVMLMSRKARDLVVRGVAAEAIEVPGDSPGRAI